MSYRKLKITYLSILISFAMPLVSCSIKDPEVHHKYNASANPLENLPKEGSLQLSIGFTQDVIGDVVYRFFSQSNGVHLLTTDENEKNFISNNLKTYKFEGESFRAVNSKAKDSIPVYRFFNKRTGGHFYTAEENEKEYISENLKDYSFEGEKFFAFATKKPKTIPIYRFYEKKAGTHFFTADKNESRFVRKNLFNYQYEGVAFYAFPLDFALRPDQRSVELFSTGKSSKQVKYVFDFTKLEKYKTAGDQIPFRFGKEKAKKYFTDKKVKNLDFNPFKGFDQRAFVDNHPLENSKTSLRIDLPKSKFGTNDSGVTAKIPLDLASSEKVYLTLDLIVKSEKIAGKSASGLGALPGFCIADCATGATRPSAENGASARIYYRWQGESLRAFSYLYHIGQFSEFGTYAPAPFASAEDDLRNLNVDSLKKESWPVLDTTGTKANRLEYFLELNSPGRSNGVVELWVNGKRMVTVNNLRLRENSDAIISALAFHFFQGGSKNFKLPVDVQFLLEKLSVGTF